MTTSDGSLPAPLTMKVVSDAAVSDAWSSFSQMSRQDASRAFDVAVERKRRSRVEYDDDDDDDMDDTTFSSLLWEKAQKRYAAQKSLEAKLESMEEYAKKERDEKRATARAENEKKHQELERRRQQKIAERNAEQARVQKEVAEAARRAALKEVEAMEDKQDEWD